MQFYWTPPPEPRAGDPAPGVPARLRRFLTLSTAAHVAGAALATWLSLSLVAPRPDEALLVRTIGRRRSASWAARCRRRSRPGAIAW
jgi:hypothetical protein